jgi:hypothetical protein
MQAQLRLGHSKLLKKPAAAGVGEVESTGKRRTQNPPPLKACRFDSDLGHQSISWTICIRRYYVRHWRRRMGTFSE